MNLDRAFRLDHPFVAAALLAPLVALFASHGLAPLEAVAAVWALWLLWRQKRLAEIAATPYAALFASLVVWALVSAIWALDRRNALSTTGGVAGLFVATLILFAAARGLDEAGRLRVRNALLAGWLLGVALLGSELLTGDFLNHTLRYWHNGQTVLRTGVNDPMTVVLLLLGFAAAAAAGRRHGLWLALLLPLPPILLSHFVNSHSTRLAGLLGYGVLLAVWLLGRRAAQALGWLTGILMLIIPLLPKGPLAPEHWQEVLSGVKYSALHRLYIWQFAAGRIAEKPLQGWGMDGARTIPGGNQPLPTGGVALGLHPHNGPLQIWLELGLPGALLAAATLWLAFATAGRLPNRLDRAAACAMLVAALTVASLSFGIWQSWWVATMGLFAALAGGALGGPARTDRN